MDLHKYELLCDIMDAMDQAYELMNEYDSMPHKYGDYLLYQSESHLIQYIGKNHGITITELSKVFKKTRSACSQLVRRLRAKGWVAQIRNVDNNREYNLHLTKEGKEVFQNHEEFDTQCFNRKCEMISKFEIEELKIYLEVQKNINEAFKEDVERSHEYFDNMGVYDKVYK